MEVTVYVGIDAVQLGVYLIILYESTPTHLFHEGIQTISKDDFRMGRLK